ncbi:MAG: murein hydrolase activator EnvC family protein [Thiotrichales bacterium]
MSNIKKELDSIVEKLRSLKGQQSSQQSDLGKREAAVVAIDREISQTVRQLRTLERDIAKQQAELKRLESQRAARATEIDRHRTLLGNHLTALFQSGQHVQWHAALEPQRLNEFLRTQTNLHYLQSARERKVEQLRNQTTELDRIAREIQVTREALAREQVTLRGQQETFKAQKKQQTQVVAELKRELGTTQANINQLNTDRQALNDLLKRLRAEAQKRQADGRGSHFDGDSPFAKLRGKLPWPAKGKLVQYASGVKIQAAEGTEVRAIGEGEVVFSDWMRGLGWLAIVNHGSGYLSLYGHNEALLVKQGERVKASAVIATAGRSGGQSESGVYFELRENTKALDPFVWCVRG